MTEIGMALGNSLHGERRKGFVGRPFPKVSAKIVNSNGEEVARSEGILFYFILFFYFYFL